MEILPGNKQKVQVTPPLTAFAKAMAVEEGYDVQVCDAIGDATCIAAWYKN